MQFCHFFQGYVRPCVFFAKLHFLFFFKMIFFVQKIQKTCIIPSFDWVFFSKRGKIITISHTCQNVLAKNFAACYCIFRPFERFLQIANIQVIVVESSCLIMNSWFIQCFKSAKKFFKNMLKYFRIEQSKLSKRCWFDLF